ncbi:heparanase-like protein 3 [Hordeum vulgare subsp. vulgare]|uniref:Heparanase-like protein 3 n=1 Tax=Hordeum vulgare subsp. vulgare TaxID=112509 RepID=A0A8I6YCD6_HORVV|nr:heparanase-like protein 3 [Hordeum vulgare subsp. vulgare]
MAGLRTLVAGLWFLAVLRLGAAADARVVGVDGRRAIASTGEDFVCATLDWWPPEKCDYGTCSWGRASLLNLDLSNKILLNAIRAFSPLVLRLGGSLQDKVVYGTADHGGPCAPFAKSESEMFGFTQGCLPMRRWDDLNAFFQKSGAKIVFGLNALNGRVPLQGGAMGGAWNISNAASLIRYTAGKGYKIHGWELGNELSGSGVGTKVGVAQYVKDAIALKTTVDSVYRGSPEKPLVLAPGGFFDAAWYSELIAKTKPSTLNVVTHHIYNLGAGVDTHLVERILDPAALDGMASPFRDLQGLLRAAGTSAVAWVGESGGAYNSGHHLVTDAFVFSFWFLDQLGMSAKFDTKSYCRQSFIGGNYGLLNTTTFQPNPDYYSALLWHRLMGTKVLEARFTGTNMVRAYAHCAKHAPGITLLLINLHRNATNHVTVASSGGAHAGAARRHGPRFGQAAGAAREEYHLTPEGGDIQSQVMMLNGRALVTGADGSIPRMEPVKVDAARHVAVAPRSIVFVHMPHFHAPACG